MNSHFHFTMHRNQHPIRGHIFVYPHDHVFSVSCKNRWNAHLTMLVGLGFPQHCEGALHLGEVEQIISNCKTNKERRVVIMLVSLSPFTTHAQLSLSFISIMILFLSYFFSYYISKTVFFVKQTSLSRNKNWSQRGCQGYSTLLLSM